RGRAAGGRPGHEATASDARDGRRPHRRREKAEDVIGTALEKCGGSCEVDGRPSFAARPEPVEGRASRSWFDRLTTSGSTSDKAAIRRRLETVSVPFPAVSVGGVWRWIDGALAVAPGAARSADLRDVEQLGRVESADRGKTW